MRRHIDVQPIDAPPDAKRPHAGAFFEHQMNPMKKRDMHIDVRAASFRQPAITPISDNLYRLDGNYIYEWTIAGIRRRMIVTKGFVFDGASVPRLAWTISGIVPDGLHRAGVLMHDWLYRDRGRIPPGTYLHYVEPDGWMPLLAHWSRKDADRMLGRLMKEAGVSRRRRFAIYWGARLFGWFYWMRR